MSDVLIRRGGDEYAHGFAGLLPRGWAWQRSEDSALMRLVRGLSEIWGVKVDANLATLLEIEADPRKTIDMLADWERAFGLPDECVDIPQTIDLRRKALLTKMTMLGGQSRAFFIAVAEALGYDIVIDEFAPYMAGVSRCGDTRPIDSWRVIERWECGGETMRFYWRVRIVDVKLTWFRAAAGESGIDHHLEFEIPMAIECLLKRWKPAHTDISFAYTSGGKLLDEMADTP